MPPLNFRGYLATYMRTNTRGDLVNEIPFGGMEALEKPRSYELEIKRITRLDCATKSDFITSL